MKIAKTDREILHIFWTTWEISMKLSEEMWFIIILKVKKKQSFTLSLENTFFEKQYGCLLPPPYSGFRVEQNLAQVITLVAEWIDTYGIHHWNFFGSSYGKLAWVGFEPTTTEFC